MQEIKYHESFDVETGAVQFLGDSPGLFLRGEDSFILWWALADILVGKPLNSAQRGFLHYLVDLIETEVP